MLFSIKHLLIYIFLISCGIWDHIYEQNIAPV